MAKSSNASPEVFGFDFQVNATIFLLLDNIKDIKTVRMEGASEDIELTMNDGNQIMAQAKHDARFGCRIEINRKTEEVQVIPFRIILGGDSRKSRVEVDDEQEAMYRELED